jgi:acyl-CoA reductase-like NAD-dependent aldehyde dehydrogenase
VIVPTASCKYFVDVIARAAKSLIVGIARRKNVAVVPIKESGELSDLLERAASAGHRVILPHQLPGLSPSCTQVRPEYVDFFLPHIVVCADPAHEIVQEESFGPILVVQPADNFEHAMQLLNGVRQGLVAALFSNDKALQERFLREAQAGILKINQATADADAVSPFGGWKASGVGPAEHGMADREFFTRMQTIYSA